MRKRVAAFAAAVLLASTMLSSCSSHMYHSEGLAYIDSVQQALIKQRLCESPNDCSIRKMAFFDGGGFKFGPYHAGGMTFGPYRTGGVHITVYNVASKAVADSLADACRKVHARYPGAAVYLTVMSTAHGETRLPWTRVQKFDIPAVRGGARHPDSGQRRTEQD